MPVPFLDLKAQYRQVGEEILRELSEVFESCGYVLGPRVQAFEAAFAAFTGTSRCVGLSSGTDAVHAMLAAAGLPPGSGVVIPPNTFTATAEGVVLAGHVPVFVDVTRGTWNLCPRGTASFLLENSATGRPVDPATGAVVRAVMPVDLYGRPAEMQAFEALCGEHGLLLFEDACQAHGASRDGRSAGSFGLAAAFSFYPGKNLGAWGEGGAVTTSSGDLADAVACLRDHGSGRKYFYETIGHNYRMEAIQGAVLGVKLRHLQSWNALRVEAARVYDELLSGLPVEVPPVEDGVLNVYHLYPVHCDRRDALAAFLSARGVASGLHYPLPLHLQRAYAHLGHSEGDFPAAEYNASRNITLPIYPEITREQQEEVAGAVADFFR